MTDRFLPKVARGGVDECWPWTASTDKRSGYGWFRVDDKMKKAHQVAWVRVNGEVPEGMVVRHSCDNPPCCNPAHLILGTQADNVRDREERQRRDVKGSRHPRAKLTERDVVEILKWLADHTWPGSTTVAVRYGVSRSTINDIIYGRSWGHVSTRDAT